MRWLKHSFSQALAITRPELEFEPHRYDLYRPRLVENFAIEFPDLPQGTIISSNPPHAIRAEPARNGYRVGGLRRFSGEIVLSTRDMEWRVAYGADGIKGAPAFIATEAARKRLQQVRGMWEQMAPRSPRSGNCFEHSPTGCTRLLILTELGAFTQDPIAAAMLLQRGSFLGALDRVWPAMSAWLRAIDCDPSSGILSGRRRDLEFGLSRIVPPIVRTTGGARH